MKLRQYYTIAVGLLCVLLVLGCGKKMTEQDYIEMAQNFLNNGRFFEAIDMYDEFLERFPDSDFAPRALFMSGYIYANELQEYDSARKYYQAFLDRFPDNDLVKSVQWEMENLGTDVNKAIGVEDDSLAEKSADTKGEKAKK